MTTMPTIPPLAWKIRPEDCDWETVRVIANIDEIDVYESIKHEWLFVEKFHLAMKKTGNFRVQVETMELRLPQNMRERVDLLVYRFFIDQGT